MSSITCKSIRRKFNQFKLIKMARYLTKSKFKSGLECVTKLYYTGKKKEYADQIKTTFCIQKYDILRGLPKTSVGNDYINVIYSNDYPEHIDSDKSKELQFLIGMNFKINILT